jgi:imidazolonepropionase-like amidohydrolase
VFVENGKIIDVSEMSQIPSYIDVINVQGRWVTPGFIDAHTHIGMFDDLQTTPGLRGDGNELTSPITPHLRAIDSFNIHDRAVKIVAKAGFTTCYTTPGSANPIGGIGLAFKLKNAASVEQVLIPGCEHMKMALGENPKNYHGVMNNRMPVTRMGIAALIRETLYRALNYSDNHKTAENRAEKLSDRDFVLEALIPVVRHEKKVRFHCHRADDIVTAIRIGQEFELDFSLEHCTEGHKIVEIIRKAQCGCVLGPILFESNKSELWGARLDTPAIMEQVGIEFCIMEDSFSATRWLPMHIGIAIANGLSMEAAFRSVTINPAKLLGIDDKVGSLEKNKDADIAVFSDNPFSNMTRCEAVMIDGKWEYNELKCASYR